MSLHVRFSAEAVKTFEAICAQIKNRWGDNTMRKFQRKVLKTIQTLSVSPFIFSIIEGYPDIRKGIINKNCSFFYEAKQEQIDILFFWDNRQDPVL